MDPGGCNSVKRDSCPYPTCTSSAGFTLCGSECADCILSTSPALIDVYELNATDVDITCANNNNIIHDWCVATAPMACERVRLNDCLPKCKEYCPTDCASINPTFTCVDGVCVESSAVQQNAILAISFALAVLIAGL
jgi:hypothetical protein